MEKSHSIWILEDDPGAQFVYREILAAYSLQLFSGIQEFLSTLRQSSSRPDLLIADLRLRDGSFMELLLSRDATLLEGYPFMVVSSLDDIDSLRHCFAKGAFDYITKPFGRAELLVKIEKIFERSEKPSLTFDASKMTVMRKGRHSYVLTPKELQIISVLHQAPNCTLAREEIIRRAWGTMTLAVKTFDVHLANVRRKISPIGLEIQLVALGHYQLTDTGSD